MKGIILAGGTGSRLYPLTKVTNKHLLPVGRKPMVFHAVEKMTGAGMTEILVVTGIEHMGDVVSLLGSGREFGCEFTYRVQDEAGGIAQALSLARNFVGDSLMTVLLGDNIFEESLAPLVRNFRQQGSGARILLKEVEDPWRFGVPEFDNGRIVAIEEKPLQPKSSFAVTGLYMYDATVFDIIATLKPSGRNELEITDVNNAYLHQGTLHFDILQGWWTDAGTFDSLAHASNLLAANQSEAPTE